jgi:peroxiredoxin
MAKKVSLIIGSTFTVTLLLVLGVQIIEKLSIKKEAEIGFQNLPSIHLLTLDSVVFEFPTGSIITLIHFNTECTYCQKELSEIEKNVLLFEQTHIVLMSTENIPAIKKAAQDYGLCQLPNVHFTKISRSDAFQTFGSMSVPHTFIYGKDKRLIKVFKGETEIETILKFLP